MTSQHQGEIFCYSDGSCTDNGSPSARAASAVVFPNEEIPDSVFYLPPTSVRSNNRAEFYAAIRAMELSNEYDPEKTKTLHIFTDSMLLLKTCTLWMHSWYKKGWKKSGGEIKNLDLVKMLHEHCRTRTIKWTHVPSHTSKTDFNSVWNDKVDKLAYSAVHDDDNSHVVFPDPVSETPKMKKFFKSKKRQKTG